MDLEKGIKIDKINRSNFHIWNPKAELILAYREVDDVVEWTILSSRPKIRLSAKSGSSVIDKPVLSYACPYLTIWLKVLKAREHEKICFQIQIIYSDVVHYSTKCVYVATSITKK